MPGHSPQPAQPEVQTRSGRARGLWRADSAAFLGIPFAAPPTGDRRFVAPAPLPQWDGVRDATQYGATAQRRPFAEVTTIPEPSIPGDSTLNVNVFTPAPGDAQAKLPVFVWIHGGGYFAGSPASPWYDGRSFNRDGVVTVTLSYRLGFDGFGWIDGAPPNRGILDQIAALQWVQDNIVNFGGDPARVTVGGQSAGGGSVLTLISSPRADGLFHGAVSQSGALSRLRPEAARDNALRLASAVGAGTDRVGMDLGAWRSVDENTIVDEERKLHLAGLFDAGRTIDDVVSRLHNAREDMLGLAFVPVVDGDIVQDFEDRLHSGAHRDTPLLLGTTFNEFTFPFPEDSAADVETLLIKAGLSADSAHQFRMEAQRLGPGHARGQLMTRARFRLPAVHIAGERANNGAGERTWLYDFRYRSAVTDAASHCSELPFVWDLLDAPGVDHALGADPPQALADTMHADWVRFIADAVCGWPTVSAHAAGAQIYDRQSTFDADAYRMEWELTHPADQASANQTSKG